MQKSWKLLLLETQRMLEKTALLIIIIIIIRHNDNNMNIKIYAYLA